jgi:hypothetical protein
MTEPEKKILGGGEAIELWEKGKFEWNRWVMKNPNADVFFKGANFGSLKQNGFVDFRGYNFPTGHVNFNETHFGNGNVSFNETHFGNGNVSFNQAHFGDGHVSFHETHFGNGHVNFNQAHFYEGNIDFSKAYFGEGNVSFNGTQFGQGHINFREAQFGRGHVSFHETHFGKGHVYFIEAQFGQGPVWFNRAQFCEGLVDFSKAQFGEGNVDFREAQFSRCHHVNFSKAQFGECDVSFSWVQFNKSNVWFDNVTFLGNANFLSLKKCEEVTVFSFRNVSFEKTFSLSGDFGCVVDMVGTKTSHHVELSGLTCHLPRNKFWYFSTTAKNKEDASRLLRLKELAEQNKHHEAALGFHADEMRAKRWRETSIPASCLDILFSAVSNYGQSIWRPVVGLFFLAIVAPCMTDVFANVGENMNPSAKGTLKMMIQNSLPFLPAAKATSSVASTLHQLGSFIFIFLIGLGLRNRFRV